MRALVVLALAAILLVPEAAGASSSQRARSPYAGLGTWIDLYDKGAWRNPEASVAAMAKDGVRTLYLETGNYRQRVDLLRPTALGRFVDAAHAAGMRVVAWYLPSFANLARDERRALAAIGFLSPAGGRFDGFALDIEATTVRGIPLRNRRLLQLSARLRWSVPRGYPLGAITPSPVGMSPTYWPGIPYRQLTHYYGAFLPMAYSTLRGIRGAKATQSYLTATVASIRTASGDPRLPVHLIGGLSGSMGTSEVAGFMRAVGACRLVGYSLYVFPTTRPSAWPALTAAPRRIAGDSCS